MTTGDNYKGSNSQHRLSDQVSANTGSRRQIAATVFDSFAPQLDLSLAAAAYGLVGLFLGSLIGELLVAAFLPRHRFAR